MGWIGRIGWRLALDCWLLLLSLLLIVEEVERDHGIDAEASVSRLRAGYAISGLPGLRGGMCHVRAARLV